MFKDSYDETISSTCKFWGKSAGLLSSYQIEAKTAFTSHYGGEIGSKYSHLTATHWYAEIVQYFVQ